jgi:hypothetical protein
MILPSHPHQVEIASLNISQCRVCCHSDMGRECHSYDARDIIYSYVPFRGLIIAVMTVQLIWTYVKWWYHTSARCKSVQKPHANLPDTPVDLTSAPKSFQILPGPPGANWGALRLCKSILRCTWNLLQFSKCIQDATRFDLYNSQILEQLRLCAAPRET